MRLVRFGPAGLERPGLIDRDGRVRDASSIAPDWSGHALAPDKLHRLADIDIYSLPEAPVGARLGAPVGGVGKIIGIALNYAEHAREAAMVSPPEPFWFLKAISALSGPDDPIVIPQGAEKVDWEIELAVIIGRRAAYVSENEALAYVAGYTIMNDVSERGFQLERGSQWTKGKSCDSFAPLGPWLVTTDEIPDPQSLSMWLDVNGVRRQASSTRNMIAGVERLVSVVSRYMSLHPGDVIATGTPAGIGFALQPQLFLRAGDFVELAIDGLGKQRQQVVSWRSQAATTEA